MVSKQEQYETLLPQAKALLEGESDPVARMANLAALIHTTFGFWWTGFYRVCPATDAPGYETPDASHGKPDGQEVVNQGNIGGPDDTSRERTDGQNSVPKQGHEILGGQKDADEGKDGHDDDPGRLASGIAFVEDDVDDRPEHEQPHDDIHDDFPDHEDGRYPYKNSDYPGKKQKTRLEGLGFVRGFYYICN